MEYDSVRATALRPADHRLRRTRAQHPRSSDQRVEVHLVSFPSTDAFAAYRDTLVAPPTDRCITASQATTGLFALYDVS